MCARQFHVIGGIYARINQQVYTYRTGIAPVSNRYVWNAGVGAIRDRQTLQLYES